MALLAPASAHANGNATVNVIHGIRGQDLGLPANLPVDVLVNNTVAIPNFQFGNIVTTQLPAGNYNIKINLAGTGTTVIEANVPFSRGENATVIAHLTAAGAPTASKFTNRIRPNLFGINVTYHHTAQAPAVDVYNTIGNFLILRTVSDLANGERARILSPVRRTSVIVTVAGTFTVALGPVPVVLRNDRNYFVYVVGSANGPAGNTLTPIVLEVPSH